jgi:hypothetical protein
MTEDNDKEWKTRIEKKVDRIAESMVQMVRTEERVSVILEQNAILFKKTAELQGRYDDMVSTIHKMEIAQTKNAQSVGFFERVWWIICAGAASVATWKFK